MAQRNEYHASREESAEAAFGRMGEPYGCPFCLSSRADLDLAKEDHAPALLAALVDVLNASTELMASEHIPRALWLALKRADDVRADVQSLPF